MKTERYCILRLVTDGVAEPELRYTEKELKAMFVQQLVDLDVPYRKIMEYLGYKSPRSISALLEVLDK